MTVRPPTVSFVSLGCPKNLVDSEKMLGLLAEAGCTIVGDGAASDVVVINTCGFLAASRDEALSFIREAAAQKRNGALKRIVVAGCLAQRDGQSLIEEVPEIDALIGVNDRAAIVNAVVNGRKRRRATESGERTLAIGTYLPKSWSDRSRLRLTQRHYAYLRMSEGCNQRCTFCTIPSIRGPMYCKSVAEIVAEARELIADGAVEINLIGQDTTSYQSEFPSRGVPRVPGLRPGDSINLAGLLRVLDRIEGARWLRLMYAYPSDFTDEMIDAIAECAHVVKYIDIPLQHINDRILKAMYRRVTRAQTESLLRRLRNRIPGVTIRTTFIAGFPGESPAEFEELRRFIADFEFDAVGVFPYSLEPGTPAGRMKSQLPDEIKQERVAVLMATQQDVAFRRASEMRGKVFDVLIDGFGREGMYPARHAGQAPEIDSVTYVVGGEFDPGEMVRVRCTSHEEYDLIAAPVTVGLPVLRT